VCISSSIVFIHRRKSTNALSQQLDYTGITVSFFLSKITSWSMLQVGGSRQRRNGENRIKAVLARGDEKRNRGREWRVEKPRVVSAMLSAKFRPPS